MAWIRGAMGGNDGIQAISVVVVLDMAIKNMLDDISHFKFLTIISCILFNW
jgi:hypothetical protein